MKPTPEQEHAIRAFTAGEDFRLRAVAGSGKTTTLRMLAEASPKKKLLYVAFNRSVAEEARAKFPPNTTVRTLHSMAYRHVVVGPWKKKFEAGRGRIPARHVMEETGLGPLFATVLRSTIEKFLRSDQPEPNRAHVPAEFREYRTKLVGRENWKREERELVRQARRIWRRMQDPDDPFPINHDTYVRLWRDRGGKLTDVDAVLVDEAQDLDPVFRDVLERSEVQKVYVGDPLQQIYAWRGAINAMDALKGKEYPLTHSFRFGEEVASFVRWAVKVLSGKEIPLVGAAPWASRVLHAEDPALEETPFAILARTNIGVVDAAVTHADEGVHVVGGVKELAWLLEDAEALRQGWRRDRVHPELSAFDAWDDVEQLAEEARHPVAIILLRLAAQHGDLLRLARRLEAAHEEDERTARVVVSTVHKAKGREWDRVRVWNDYPPFEELDYDEEEVNILYVALTRARRVLDVGEIEIGLLEVQARKAGLAKRAEPWS